MEPLNLYLAEELAAAYQEMEDLRDQLRYSDQIRQARDNTLEHMGRVVLRQNNRIRELEASYQELFDDARAVRRRLVFETPQEVITIQDTSDEESIPETDVEEYQFEMDSSLWTDDE